MWRKEGPLPQPPEARLNFGAGLGTSGKPEVAQTVSKPVDEEAGQWQDPRSPSCTELAEPTPGVSTESLTDQEGRDWGYRPPERESGSHKTWL